MEAKPRTIEHYVDAADRCPFAAWMESVEHKKIHGIILNRLERVKLGSFGKWKPVGEGANELIFDFEEGYRVYFGFDGKSIVLLCAGPKKTQTKDIKTAIENWRDYCA